MSIKNGKCQLLKMVIARYILILTKPSKDLELASNHCQWVKNMLEMFVIQQTSTWPGFTLIVLQKKSKKISISVTSITYQCLRWPMMTLQSLESVDLAETQKSRYLENETLFFLQIKKKSLIAHQGILYGKK